MDTDFDFDYVSLDERAADALDGWEAVQSLLASDEAYARFLYESFHGAEY